MCSRSRGTVRRAARCLLGLDSVVASLFHERAAAERVGPGFWAGKAVVTFCDALGSVRLRLWSEGVLRQLGLGSGLEKRPAALQELLGQALAPAA